MWCAKGVTLMGLEGVFEPHWAMGRREVGLTSRNIMAVSRELWELLLPNKIIIQFFEVWFLICYIHLIRSVPTALPPTNLALGTGSGRSKHQTDVLGGASTAYSTHLFFVALVFAREQWCEWCAMTIHDIFIQVGFLWYTKNISPWALLGFAAALGTYQLLGCKEEWMEMGPHIPQLRGSVG